MNSRCFKGMFGHLQVNPEWFLCGNMFLYSTWHGQNRLDHWAFGSTPASSRDVLQSNRTCCAERQHQKMGRGCCRQSQLPLYNSKRAYRTSRHHCDIEKRNDSNSSILHVHCRFQEGHRHGLCIVFVCFSI